MKFMKVEDGFNPRRKRKNGKLKYCFDDFMAMNTTFAKIDYSAEGYRNASSALSSLRKSVARFGYPIDIFMVNGTIYFARKDM